MGPLTLPASGSVYLDANAFIYSYERIEPYRTLLEPVWLGAGPHAYDIITSELTLLEVLVAPIKQGNATLQAGFKRLLLRSKHVRSVRISRSVLERAGALRAETGLKTPDAIHAATALMARCALLLTNDSAFRRVPGLNVTVLRDLLPPNSDDDDRSPSWRREVASRHATRANMPTQGWWVGAARWRAEATRRAEVATAEGVQPNAGASPCAPTDDLRPRRAHIHAPLRLVPGARNGTITARKRSAAWRRAAPTRRANAARPSGRLLASPLADPPRQPGSSPRRAGDGSMARVAVGRACAIELRVESPPDRRAPHGISSGIQFQSLPLPHRSPLVCPARPPASHPPAASHRGPPRLPSPLASGRLAPLSSP